MFTAGRDGSDLRLVLQDGMVSHFDWRNDRKSWPGRASGTGITFT